MTKIDDFLGDLEPGYEIDIPKDWITEESSGWKTRLIGLPKEGSLGQFYKGQYHAHDMGDYYAVHKDRVDPDIDPIGHLVQDAPQVVVAAGVGLAGLYLAWLAFRDETDRE